MIPEIHSDSDSIAHDLRSGEVVETELRTSQRVLARITDGIYRQPASALREIIANAYDADATEVIVTTDAPRFAEIRVRDNGTGMSPETLATVIHSIGGSSKRTLKGINSGITSPTDASKSPKGRKLIGKIGIGLFSVAQLTRQFRIITKCKNEEYRLVADIILNTYSDDWLEKINDDSEEYFNAGSVKLWTVATEDVNSQGTEIIIRNLTARVRDELRSKGRWYLVDAEGGNDADPPLFHVGKVDLATGNTIEATAHLPWTDESSPSEKFSQMVDSVINSWKPSATPSVVKIFDTYLQSIWTLSQSLPLDYIDYHPFDVISSESINLFKLSNSPKGQATILEIPHGESVREYLKLESPVRVENDSFKVFIDDVELARPMPTLRLPKTKQAVREPLLFFGQLETNFSDAPVTVSGGNLKFEAYVLWTNIVVPKENAGVMIRIHDASGTLFDSDFMQYPGGDGIRKKQTIVEIYVLEGLESALNIDRESYNTSHPHYQVIAKWVHNALRQTYNRQKSLAREVRNERKYEEEFSELHGLDELAKSVLDKIFERYGYQMSINFVDGGEYDDPEDISDSLVFDLDNVGATSVLDKEKKRYIVKILAAYGLMDGLEQSEAAQLYEDLMQVIFFNGRNK